jgi:hypothetical protein
MEMSPHSEVALVTGDRLREVSPDMGHLVHMPTHIDIQCGHYRDAMHWNQKAVIADRKFYDRAGPMNFYSGQLPVTFPGWQEVARTRAASDPTLVPPACLLLPIGNKRRPAFRARSQSQPSRRAWPTWIADAFDAASVLRVRSFAPSMLE